MNRILRCPDCNTPLIPGSISCIKCNKQFSKPIPKIAEPKPAEPPIAPIPVTPVATPLKSAYKPQSKVLFATVLIVVCLIALVTFVVNRSQVDEREALAQKQAYQRVLQNQAKLQQAPVAVSVPAPVVMTPAPSLKRNNVDWSKVDKGLTSSTNGASSNDNSPQASSDNNQQQAQNSPVDNVNSQVEQYYSDGQATYEEGLNYLQSDDSPMPEVSGYVNKIDLDAQAIRGLQNSAHDGTTATYCALKATELGTMKNKLISESLRNVAPQLQDPGAITSLSG